MSGNAHIRDGSGARTGTPPAVTGADRPTVLTAPDGSAAEGAAEAYSSWRDPTRPAAERVEDLLARMTLEEKVAQLYSLWVGGSDGDGDVAPQQDEMMEDVDWAATIPAGLGQLTRPFGTAPVPPGEGARGLARLQREIIAAGRFGIPALAHEECLAGFTTWQATIYPVPLAWGASFDPELVEKMAAQIGGAMRSVGVHQGLAPVLDVARDLRWGRIEESVGEDPYLVGTVATAYVRGLQSTGIIATLKHFVGYSASRSGRNHAPTAIGPRELNDVLLPPFEMAVRAGAGSVMNSYAEIDGLPPAADPSLFTGLLRDSWGFTGTVVSDYFAVAFLEQTHHVAADRAGAAGLALAAGIDVELPAVYCFGAPLIDAVRAGDVPESLVDRAARRVLLQKCQLGLLDAGFSPEPPVGDEPIDLDPPEARELARRLAEESVVLVANDGTLPLRPGARVAVVGPLADDADAMLGCYSFPRHMATRHPGLPLGLEIPSLLQALRREVPEGTLSTALGCTVDGPETGGFAAAVAAARAAEACVVVLGDRAGLFGDGTSGEGCDAPDLALPGVQAQLLDALLETGTPVVAVLFSGRTYALGAHADRLAGVVQAFFPGEEGGPAVAGVLTGRFSPSGRLPVGIPRQPGGQPATYLAPALGQRNEVSNLDPSALYPFGHGLSYTSFEWTEAFVDASSVATDGAVTVAVTVCNTGGRAGTEVVQLYLHDPVAQVTRPVMRLIGYARVDLEPGRSRRVEFAVHADLTAFTGRDGRRVVEPGEIELRLAASSADVKHALPVRLTGPERRVDHRRVLTAGVSLR